MTNIYSDLLLIINFSPQYKVWRQTQSKFQMQWILYLALFTAFWWFLFPFYFAKKYTHTVHTKVTEVSVYSVLLPLSIVLIQIKWDVSYNLAKLLDMKHHKKWLERSAVNFHESHKNSEKTFMQRFRLHNHSLENVSSRTVGES